MIGGTLEPIVENGADGTSSVDVVDTVEADEGVNPAAVPFPPSASPQIVSIHVFGWVGGGIESETRVGATSATNSDTGGRGVGAGAARGEVNEVTVGTATAKGFHHMCPGAGG